MKKIVSLTALALTVAISATAMSATAAQAVTVTDDGDSKLKISGKAFLGFTQVDNDGTKTIGGNVDRFYFQAKYTKDIWTARITTDVNNEQDNGAFKREMNVFLKYAYLEGKFSDAATLRLGLSHTPWIDYEQKLWGHRYVSKVTSDYMGYDTSSDYGIGLKGKFADNLVSYWVTATNGGGYGKPNQTGAVDLNTRVTFKPMDGLDVSLQYVSGYKGKKTDSTVDIADKHTMTQVMVSYGTSDFRVGVNAIDVKNLKTATGDDRTATGLWATGKFSKEFGAFARLDSEDKAGVKKDHTVIGFDYFAQKGVTLTAAYDLKDDNGTKTTTVGLFSLVKF